MSLPRRFLPSTAALIAFEAAARHGSATQAAAELNLTQGAVSRQIKALEEQLGVTLMTRQGRALGLTHAGARYAEDVREILTRLGKATLGLRTNPLGGALNLSILPAFGMHWLAPRLPDFGRAHPEVTVNLSTRLAPFDFGTQPFDAAIHFGREDWPGAHHMYLAPETVLAVCAPGHMNGPLQDHTLLHLETRPRGWDRWLRAKSIPQPKTPGMQFDQFSTMAQAAVHGLGIALLPTFVAEPYLESGTLELAAPDRQDSIGSYYLVWPQGRPETGALKAFRTWLSGIAAPHKAAPSPPEGQGDSPVQT
ncbi:LysR family transcriptional regulator [Aliishimia ponticola]|uniref:LysR family transcriptional regulator n=2 Tax=Aliishimia ponticola TaxID=2499833 RepID=A0A4S4NML6_9RHOB|nr:LysR family transcriptional regulator [Aliishimia ponticola]